MSEENVAQQGSDLAPISTAKLRGHMTRTTLSVTDGDGETVVLGKLGEALGPAFARLRTAEGEWSIELVRPIWHGKGPEPMWRERPWSGSAPGTSRARPRRPLRARPRALRRAPGSPVPGRGRRRSAPGRTGSRFRNEC